MGLLSKLFGSDETAQNALEKVKAMFETNDNGSGTEISAPQDSADNYSKRMPNEPNQFNFGGTYTEYFESILREDFRQFTFTTETVREGTGTVLTLFENGRKMLVIELMSERCSSRKLRSNCQAEGTPYLRFYYDHLGWWNVRSYVVGRIRSALQTL